MYVSSTKWFTNNHFIFGWAICHLIPFRSINPPKQFNGESSQRHSAWHTFKTTHNIPNTNQMPIQKLASIALALDPRLPSLHQGRANAENPGLILHCDFPSSNELYSVNLEQYNNQITSINARLKSSISEYHIVGSSNGMLCIASALHSKPIFACNPFGRDFIELREPFNYPDQKVALGFCYHPTTEECKLVWIAFFLKHYRTTRSRVWSWRWCMEKFRPTFNPLES